MPDAARRERRAATDSDDETGRRGGKAREPGDLPPTEKPTSPRGKGLAQCVYPVVYCRRSPVFSSFCCYRCLHRHWRRRSPSTCAWRVHPALCLKDLWRRRVKPSKRARAMVLIRAITATTGRQKENLATAETPAAHRLQRCAMLQLPVVLPSMANGLAPAQMKTKTPETSS